MCIAYSIVYCWYNTIQLSVYNENHTTHTCTSWLVLVKHCGFAEVPSFPGSRRVVSAGPLGVVKSVVGVVYTTLGSLALCCA